MNRAIALLFLCEFLTAGRASAQGVPAHVPPPQQAASAIELSAQPEHGAPGTPVTILGTVAVKGSNAVTITVKPPAGAPFSHTVSTNASGAFTLQFQDTKTPGVYSVQATVGASTAAAAFGIGSADIAQNTIQQVQELLLTADSLVREGKRQYDGNRTVADAKRAATDQQIAQLQDKIAEAKKLWTPSSPGSSSAPPTLADMLLEITAQVQSRPDLGARYAPALNQLQAWSEQSKTSMQRFKRREPLMKSMHSMNRLYGGMLTPVSFRVAAAETEGTSGGGAGTCESLQEVVEYLEMAGSAFSLMGKGSTVLLNVLTSYIGSKAGEPTGIPIAAHGIMVGQELDEWKHDLDPKVGVATIGAHLATEVAHSILENQCGQFTGPFHITMRAEAKIYDHTWWKFEVAMDGTLTLLFKNTDWTYKGKVPFTGEFEGQGTRFTVWEDAAPVLYKKIFQPGMTVSWHKVSATRVTDFSNCTDCVVPLRAVAVKSEDFSPDGSLPFTASRLGYGPLVEASGQPNNVAISMLPGLKGMLSTPGLNRWSASYFRIPVEGDLEDYGNISVKYGRPMCDRADHIGRLHLSVVPAKSDWDPALINAHVKYLVLTSGLPLPVPLVLDFGLPYPSAEFILKRALGNTKPASTSSKYLPFTDEGGGAPQLGDVVYQITGETAVEMTVDPGTTGRPVQVANVPRSTDPQDCSVLTINYEHQNAMPRTKVSDVDNNKTGQAWYSITLNLVGGPEH